MFAYACCIVLEVIHTAIGYNTQGSAEEINGNDNVFLDRALLCFKVV